MLNDSFFFSILSQLAWSLPTLVTCIIGIVLLRSRALSQKAKSYGVTGLALTILGSLGGLVFNTFLRTGSIDYASSGFQFMQMGFSAVMQLLHVASLAFLILAICDKSHASDQKSEAGNPYGQ